VEGDQIGDGAVTRAPAIDDDGGRSDLQRFGVGVAFAATPGTLFAVLFILTSSYVIEGRRYFTLFDDAMISMTYGRTLAYTGELVWFPGAPRVQGFTNPLWTFVMALVHVLGLEGSSAALAVSLIGAATVTTTAVLIAVAVRRELIDSPLCLPFSLAAGAVVPFLFPLLFWSLRGMEVGLLALLSTGVVVFLPSPESVDATRHAYAMATTLAVLGIVTRLDFAVLCVAVGVIELWVRHDAAFVRRLAKGFLLPIAIAGVVVVLAQRLYYGSFLPNTYALKLGGFSIGERATRGFVNLGKELPLVVIISVAAACGLGFAGRRSMLLLRSSGVAFGCFAYSVWVGGDAWEWTQILNRYTSVCLPLVAAMLFVLIARIQWSIPVIGAATLACLGMGAFSNPTRYDSAVAYESLKVGMVAGVLLAGALIVTSHVSGARWFEAALLAMFLVALVGVDPVKAFLDSNTSHVAADRYKTLQGEALGRLTTEDAVIATVWAGAPAYYSNRRMVDLLGKSDAHVASVAPLTPLYPGHNKWDYAYSITQLQPDVIIDLWRERTVEAASGDVGYERRCYEIGPDGLSAYSWFRRSSTNIDWPSTAPC
jgi:hypothetical protein